MTTTPLDVMRTLAGTQWSSGPAKGAVREWVELIASTYPDKAKYVRQAELQYLAWCGLTCAYTVTRCGIRPPDEFLLAMDWTKWGTDARSSPQQGDIAVYAWPSGGHHVTEIDEITPTHFKCFGGNQSHQVNDEPMPRSSCIAVRRPPSSSGIIIPLPSSPSIVPIASNFNACVSLILVSEGGNDDDPNDRGGRTSRGITQTEWNKWRALHPNLSLTTDVWLAPQDQIIAIYRTWFWDALQCDRLPAGIDYVEDDFGVNSGISRSAKFLQAIVGVDQDGEIGQQTIDAAAAADAKDVINALCDHRMEFLRGLKSWSSFGHGWTARVERVRTDGLGMAIKGKAHPDVPAPPRPPTQPPLRVPRTLKFDPLNVLGGIDQLFGFNKQLRGV